MCLVEKNWLEQLKDYVLYHELKSPGHYGFDRNRYFTKLTVPHMDTSHPGRIPNEKLLKEFHKYIRVENKEDTSNYVLRGKLYD